MFNSVILMGRLVADPELRTTPNGISVTTFRIAVDRGYVKAGEEKQTDFIDIVAWRQSAEFVCRYFKKGSLIIVQGSLQSRQYEDKNGNKRTAYEVVADRVSFGGPKSDNPTGPRPEDDIIRKEEPVSFSNATGDDFQETLPDEDLPF